MRHLQPNNVIVEGLDERVTGHSEVKKVLAVMLSRIKHRLQQKYERFMDDDYLISPMKVLIMGGSGTGKTHLLHSLQQIEHFPIVKLDATHLNPTGGSGGLTPAKVKKMIMDEAELQCAILPSYYPSIDYAVDSTVVFIDEIDKLGRSFESSGNWNQHVQSNFLTLFDNKEEFSGVTFVFAGAFHGEKELKKNSIGFHKEDTKMDEKPLDRRALDAGLIPELVGRITYMAALDVFTKKDYVAIIKDRLVPKKMMDLAALGVFGAKITNKQIDEIAESATKSDQGVRYAMRRLDQLFLDIEFQSNCRLFLED